MATTTDRQRHVFDEDTPFPLVVEESVWLDSLRLDIRTYYTTDTDEVRPTKKGVSLTAEKAAWLLPLLTTFVAAEADISDSARNAIEASFAVLQTRLLGSL